MASGCSSSIRSPASAEPRTLVAKAQHSRTEHRIANVLVGEVWIGSGQSNMQFAVSQGANAKAEIEAANYPNIRLFSVPNRALPEPQRDVDASWKVCSPDTVGAFSGVAYFFGRELLKNLDVPIGLINCSWGGTRVEAWTSREALMTYPDTQREVIAFEKLKVDPAQAERHLEFARDPSAWERNHAAADPGNTAHARGWASADFDDSSWDHMSVPSRWQDNGHNYSGVFWFRRHVDVPNSWAGKELVLHLGACDKHDTTYFNNEQVGSIGWETVNAWCTPRVYRIPGHLVRAGRNTIAVRAYSYIYHGGLIGPADTMRLLAENDSGLPPVPLTGAWRYNIEHNLGLIQPPQPPLGAGNPNTTFILYNSMLTPLVPYGIRGAIWYQGESNAGNPRAYRDLFPLMIRDWRRTWGQGDFAFDFVQLANYMPEQTTPIEKGWAELREAQVMALREPNTGMAVAIDIGQANDIHPVNKQDVGKRLAFSALSRVYVKSVTPSGPLYKSHTVEGDAIRVRFDHAAGLKTSDGGQAKGFAIAGPDGKFIWADATIDGGTVIVRSAQCPKPAAVRYAWANNPVCKPVQRRRPARLPVPHRCGSSP